MDASPKGQKNHIDNAKKYVGPQDTSWWIIFFIDQQGIIDYSFGGVWPLQLAFTWSVQHTRNWQSPPRVPNAGLDNLLYPHQRDIYVGPSMIKAAYALLPLGVVRGCIRVEHCKLGVMYV